ncbi:phosphorothioated DNA-binding restriction endonuclease [Nocardiopsis alborubida]|uniref:Restriction endonuclease n=1 Tax=Nocardiopsis alborubida TaxID=146802 RepID=A0A7X6MBA1_9ACTN|nr:HNH endonuclease [Nocardiopsis alborubida]NKY98236.1 restriction endonuclease [Nocardiopsis alborubida]
MDWTQRLGSVKRWTRAGVRAPHKPLLLLYALAHHQRHGNAPIVYSEAEARLARLLREFGPAKPTHPGYPFHHLETDGFWRVTTVDGEGSPGSGVTLLRGREARGRLSADLDAALRDDPGLAARIGRHLLDDNFAPSLHEGIIALTGLSVGQGPVPAPGEGGVRDPRFREAVLTAYEHRCAFCGYEGRLDDVSVGLEAAHIRWWSHDGPNDLDNGLCLCPTHHLLFDRGVLGLTGELTVAVSPRFEARSPAAETVVLSLAGRELLRPDPGHPAVEPAHVDWHSRQVFRRAAA